MSYDPWNDNLDLLGVRLDAEMEYAYQADKRAEHGCPRNCRHEYGSNYCIKECDSYGKSRFAPAPHEDDPTELDIECRAEELAAIDDYNNHGGY